MSINVYLDTLGGNTVGALASNDRLLEYHIEKNDSSQIVGTIYKGEVKNVLNGMQAAFIDVGLSKNGYLFVGDTLIDRGVFEQSDDFKRVLDIKEGDEIMVQAVKEPSGSKGVRLTKHISLAGKFVVYVPSLQSNSISRKITDEDTRKYLEKVLNSVKCKSGAFIARTASETANSREIKSEMKILLAQYDEILEKYKTAKIGESVHCDGDLVSRLMRDVLTADVEKIFVSDKTIYDRLKNMPKSRNKLKKKLILFTEKTDMLKKFGLDKDVDGLLHNRVNLSSGAYLIIDKTEALTVIDVNTGGFTGEDNLEDTVFRTNLLAAEEIARQVRLRNVGGIVVVDFIDMTNETHREMLVKSLKNALKTDRFKCNVVGMTGLGLVEFTRNKKRKEISSVLRRDCPYCHGEGKILSDDYIVMKLRTGLLDLFAEDYKSAIIDLNAEICEFILSTGALTKDISKFWSDKRIYVVPHKTYHHETFYLRGDNSDVLTLSDKATLLY